MEWWGAGNQVTGQYRIIINLKLQANTGTSVLVQYKNYELFPETARHFLKTIGPIKIYPNESNTSNGFITEWWDNGK